LSNPKRIESFTIKKGELEGIDITDKSIDVSAACTKLLRKYNALLNQVNGIKKREFGVLFKDDPEDEDDSDDDSDDDEEEVKIVAKVPRKKVPVEKEPIKKVPTKKVLAKELTKKRYL
jgi:hypothetical protein